MVLTSTTKEKTMASQLAYVKFESEPAFRETIETHGFMFEEVGPLTYTLTGRRADIIEFIDNRTRGNETQYRRMINTIITPENY